jgi:A/G-specific adenine glycosylase
MPDRPDVDSAPLAERLLAWYDRHRRTLPWRAPPGERADPYAVWLSEIMLQQTTVAAVGPYFERFLARWPNVAALAAAPLDDVLAEWAGLGYYARARNMHAAAKAVAARGGFPADVDGLRALPGIGPYTAAAIAAIAFDVKASAMDGNVERVVARLRAVREALPGAKKTLAALAEELVPDERPGDYAQAIMDLGATICSPRRPACALCPWNHACLARAQGIAEDLPAKAPKAERPRRYGIAFWATRPDGAVLLRRRPEKGLLGGMMEVPSTDWGPAPPSAEVARRAAPLVADWAPMAGTVEHVFTHFALSLAVWQARVADVPAPQGARWVAPADLAREALPSVMRKIVGFAEGRAGRGRRL